MSKICLGLQGELEPFVTGTEKAGGAAVAVYMGKKQGSVRISPHFCRNPVHAL